ncbi:hypothetical protein [Cohnella panacarvi]|uniref:hypothetical protein n=1 Tax=Cohnella panacarvi TaxID=400776 RepID=UPI00047EE7D8|nr:hypothetical protein [Cohnella panacarvi]
MEPQLIEALREVMQSELKKGLSPVHTKLDRLDARVGKLDERVSKLDARVGKLDERVSKLDARVGKLDERVSKLDARVGKLEGITANLDGKVGNLEVNMETVIRQLSAMQNQLDRIEHTQNDDVVAILHQVNQKTADRFERTDNQMRVLNDRLFTVETDIRKLQQS